MTILVDEPRWWFEGRKWCHLVSDVSLDELHEFADRVGMPRRGFQGDHYDVPEEYRARVVAAGAAPVESRELLRRLRAAGLRLSPAARRASAPAITTPATMPGTMPGTPGTMPGTPDTMPGAIPGAIPTSIPGTDPGPRP